MPTIASTPIPSPQAIILAAGKGTRMACDKPKVLYPVADQPMVKWVVQACRRAGVERCIVVIGYGGDQVRAALANEPACIFVEQKEQLGTGHAVRMAQPLFFPDHPVDVFVLAGDGPLIRQETLHKLLEVHRARHAAATLATAILDDPTGYGRVIRGADGSFKTIVEQKDATPEQLRIHEVNPSYYCFRSNLLFATLGQVNNANQSGEYYLTDVPELLRRQGHVTAVVEAVPPQDVLSINTPQQLAEVDRILRERLGTTGPSRAKESPKGVRA